MQDNIQSQPIQQDAEKLNETFKNYYSDKQSQAMKKALQLKREQGYYLGNPPIGYFRSKTNNDIIPHPKEKYIIIDTFERYSAGASTLSEIADDLNCADIRTRRNKMFSHNTIYSILKNKAYIGIISSPRKSYPDIKGRHQPIISEELFNEVQIMLKKRKRPKMDILGLNQ